jgi:hypothetical protein
VFSLKIHSFLTTLQDNVRVISYNDEGTQGEALGHTNGVLLWETTQEDNRPVMAVWVTSSCPLFGMIQHNYGFGSCVTISQHAQCISFDPVQRVTDVSDAQWILDGDKQPIRAPFGVGTGLLQIELVALHLLFRQARVVLDSQRCWAHGAEDDDKDTVRAWLTRNYPRLGQLCAKEDQKDAKGVLKHVKTRTIPEKTGLLDYELSQGLYTLIETNNPQNGNNGAPFKFHIFSKKHGIVAGLWYVTQMIPPFFHHCYHVVTWHEMTVDQTGMNSSSHRSHQLRGVYKHGSIVNLCDYLQHVATVATSPYRITRRIHHASHVVPSTSN